MQLLHENMTVQATVKGNMSSKEATPESMEVKEKKSSNSNGSLLRMNPVASGDNVATGLNSAHKLKEDLPPLVPCCEGKELQINEDLVRTGLSAISVRHDGVIHCMSMSSACEKMQVPSGLVKHRNSFRCLHRPDLKRVPYLRRMTPEDFESLFRSYADLHVKGIAKNVTEHREQKESARVNLPPDEDLRSRDAKHEADQGGSSLAFHSMPDTCSRVRDVPVGMRLHVARARLYTSVLARAKAGDQLDAISSTENYEDTRDLEDPIDLEDEDEEPLNEELQIILPPRVDDVIAGSSASASTNHCVAR